MRTFARAGEFWEIQLAGDMLMTVTGAVGTPRATRMETFPDADRARAAHYARVAEQLAAGFVETTGRPPAAVPLRHALEAALVANPDDVATHAAYADHLTESGDPRGEFVAVQLALEDPGKSADERRRLQTRERELLDRHAREWAGDAGRFLVGDWSGPDKPFDYRFARGWLDAVRTLPFPEAVFPALGRSPEVRLLRALEVVYDMRYHPWEFDQFLDGPNRALKPGERPSETYEQAAILPPLIESSYLTNLRTFRLGFGDGDGEPRHSTMVGVFAACTGPQVIELLKRNPRVEELYLNTALLDVDELLVAEVFNNVRVFQYYFGSAYALGAPGDQYPLSYLAGNRSLGRLTTLRLHPGREEVIDVDEFDALLQSPNLPGLQHLQVHMTTFGDEGCRRVVESGVLKRLKTLDLAYGAMTDAGAAVLAASPDLKRLEVLDVSRNALTAAGVRALRATGVRVVADEQHDADSTDFLFGVDVE